MCGWNGSDSEKARTDREQERERRIGAMAEEQFVGCVASSSLFSLSVPSSVRKKTPTKNTQRLYMRQTKGKTKKKITSEQAAFSLFLFLSIFLADRFFHSCHMYTLLFSFHTTNRHKLLLFHHQNPRYLLSSLRQHRKTTSFFFNRCHMNALSMNM
jgi:hypothetical protein